MKVTVIHLPGGYGGGGGAGGTSVSFPILVNQGGTGGITAALARAGIGAASAEDLSEHTGDLGNPHQTNAEQVGAIPVEALAAPGGVATLGDSGKILGAQMPAISLSRVTRVENQAAMLNLGPIQVQEGDFATLANPPSTYLLGAGDPSELSSWVLITQGIQPPGPGDYQTSDINNDTPLAGGDLAEVLIGLKTVQDQLADDQDQLASAQGQLANDLQALADDVAGLGGEGGLSGNLAALQALGLLEGDMLIVTEDGLLQRLAAPEAEETRYLTNTGGQFAWGEPVGSGSDPFDPEPWGSYPEGVWGTGLDGAVTISVNTTISQDLHCTSLTINSGRVLTIGWVEAENRPARIYCTGSLTLVSSGRISADGVGPVAGDNNGLVPGPTSLGCAPGSGGGEGGDAGQFDMAPFDPTPGESVGNSIGGRGGHGGNSPLSGGVEGYGPGSIGGTVALVTLVSLDQVVAGATAEGPVRGGAGGGAGGIYGARRGFGGAGGGGVGYIAARKIITTSTTAMITARGGNGLAGNATSARGGGAPGGGGGLIVICEEIDARITLSAARGTGGGSSFAASAAPGRDGHVYLAAWDPFEVTTVLGLFHPVTVAA